MKRQADLRLSTLIAIAAGCCLMSFAYQAMFMNHAISLYDEGTILFGARRVMDGDVIHRDFYANYGPGQFYTLAMLFKLFSPSILVERLWDCGARSVSVAIIFLLVARTTRSVPAGIGTAAACMVWLASFGFYGYPVFPALSAVLAGMLCLSFAFDAPRPAWSLAAGGLCVGVAFLFRYDIGLFTAVVMTGLLGLHAALRPGSARQRIGHLAGCVGVFSLGFALVVLPLLCAYIVQGVMGDLVFDIVTYPSRYYYSMRSLPFPGPRQLAEDPLAGIVYLPLVLVAVASAGLAVDYRTRQTRGEAWITRMGPWIQILLIALTLLYFAKGFVRVSPIHMSLSLVTALVLAGIATADLKAHRGARRAGLVATLALTAGLTLVLFARNTAEAGDTVHDIVAGADHPVPGSPLQSIRLSCGALTGMQRLACFSLDRDHLQTLEFLKARTRPGDYVYVGLDRHDKIFINDAALYFLADLRSATKWHQFDPGLQNSVTIQREMIGELQHHRPRYVVLESQWDDVQEPNGSARSSGVLLLDQYIRDNFRPAARFGAMSVLDRVRRP